MRDSMASAMSLPRGMPTTRYKPPPPVELPSNAAELPLFDKNTPADQQIQEHWVSHVDVFTDLSDETQREKYTQIWQKVSDGHAVPSTGNIEAFDEKTGKFVALLRWSELRYKVPPSKG